MCDGYRDVRLTVLRIILLSHDLVGYECAARLELSYQL